MSDGPPWWFQFLFPTFVARKKIMAALVSSYGYDARWWWSDGRLGRALAVGVIRSRVRK